KLAQHLRPASIVSGDHATFAGAQMFDGMKAEHGQVRETANSASAILRAQRVTCIFNNHQPTRLSYSSDGLEIGRMTGILHSDIRTRSQPVRAQRLYNCLNIIFVNGLTPIWQPSPAHRHSTIDRQNSPIYRSCCHEIRSGSSASAFGQTKSSPFPCMDPTNSCSSSAVSHRGFVSLA